MDIAFQTIEERIYYYSLTNVRTPGIPLLGQLHPWGEEKGEVLNVK